MNNEVQHVEKSRPVVSSSPYLRLKSMALVTILLALIVILSSSHIFNEDFIALNGDMARYMMGGVYFRDVLADFPIGNPFHHAYRYFAQYPALSLGHHPLLISVAEAPIFYLFGISVFSARLTIVLFIMMAAIFWYLSIRLLYGEIVAFISTMLFVTSPIIVEYSRIVMSEIPTLALISMAFFFLIKYCQNVKTGYAYMCAIAIVLSIYSKHLAVMMLPVYFLFFVYKRGLRSVLNKHVLTSAALIFILLIPLALITLKFSQKNLHTISIPIADKLGTHFFSSHLKSLWKHQLTFPVIILSVASMLLGIARKEKMVIIFIAWILSCYLLDIYLGITRPRDSIYWVPVFCLFAAKNFDAFKNRGWKISLGLIFAVIIGYQAAIAYDRAPEFTSGYKEAAKVIIGKNDKSPILYGCTVDTGYFIFFIRKFDTDREMVILRADKIFATSSMNQIIEDKVRNKDQLYRQIDNFGIRYIVLEEYEIDSLAYNILRQELVTEKFEMIKEIPVISSRPYIKNLSLKIFQYKEYKKPNKETVVEMNIPLMGDTLKVKLGDIMKPKKPKRK